MNRVFEWISKNKTFDDPKKPELPSVSSGLTASGGARINCVIVEETLFRSLERERFRELTEEDLSSASAC